MPMVHKKPHTPWTIAHYVNGQSCLDPLHDLGKASRQQRYFRRACSPAAIVLLGSIYQLRSAQTQGQSSEMALAGGIGLTWPVLSVESKLSTCPAAALRCLCGEHFTYRTVKAVNDDPRALMCPHVECLDCDCSPYLACSCVNSAYESPDAKADALWCDPERLTTALC